MHLASHWSRKLVFAAFLIANVLRQLSILE
jgi:hypothetical protein